MPELPEVETVVAALKKEVTGRRITHVEVFSPRLRTPIGPLADANLAGEVISAVRRRGRYIILELGNSHRGIIMHLGMSGVLRSEPPDIPRRKHEHIFFHLSNNQILRFECTRRFSLCEVCDLEGRGGFPKALDVLGVEPLEEQFSEEYLYNLARKRTGCVKNFIMDNAVVVGIGNIYAAETLFDCAVSPLRHAKDLTRNECARIVSSIRRILTDAICAGGSTISDYKQLDGSEGKFARQLKMYGRKGAKCMRCGSRIEQVVIGGRSSCYCPECQK